MTDPKKDETETLAAPPTVAPPGPLREPEPATITVVKRGGGWSFLFATVALAAAGASIAGPSLRPLLVEQLTQRFGPHPLIPILTGTATPAPKSVVEIDLEAFDRRVVALGSALKEAGGATADPALVATLTQALGQAQPVTPQQLAALSTTLSAEVSAQGQRLSAELENRIALLSGRVEALGHRLDEVATTATQAQESGRESGRRLGAVEEADAAAARRLDGLQADLAALKDGTEATAAKAAERLSALDTKLGDIEGRLGKLASGNRNAAALVALSTRIRVAVEASEPFVSELNAAKALATDDPAAAKALEVLGPLAPKGVSSFARLRRDLAGVTKEIQAAAEPTPAAWYNRTLNAVQSAVFFWSPQAPGRAEQVNELLGRVSQLANGGRMADAVRELKTLEGPGAELAEGWIRSANQKLDADRAVRLLTELSVRRLAAGAQ